MSAWTPAPPLGSDPARIRDSAPGAVMSRAVIARRRARWHRRKDIAELQVLDGYISQCADKGMSPFEAIAEPNRRRLLDLGRAGERPAGDFVGGHRPQPAGRVEASHATARSRPRQRSARRPAPALPPRTRRTRRARRAALQTSPSGDLLGRPPRRPRRPIWRTSNERTAPNLPDAQAIAYGERAPGRSHCRHGDALQLVFHRRYNKSVEKVWAALTTPERLADWFATAEVEMKVGRRDPARLERRGVHNSMCRPPSAAALGPREQLRLDP